MKKPSELSVTIPSPCHERWQDMIPAEGGRYCAQCDKCVIDFTTWTDEALSRYFQKNKTAVCGRFHDAQLERVLLQQKAPSNRRSLFRTCIGLWLLLSNPISGKAFTGASTESSLVAGQLQKTTGDSISSISIRLLDEQGVPVIGGVIQVLEDNIRRAGAITDENGFCTIEDLPPGQYVMFMDYADYRTLKETISLVGKTPVSKTYSFSERSVQNSVHMTKGYVVPLITYDESQRPKGILGRLRAIFHQK